VPLTTSTSITQETVLGPVTPETLFLTLTDPDLTPYFFNRCSFRCDNSEPGAPYSLVAGDEVVADGVILEYQPPLTIVLTFAQRWDRGIGDPPGRVRFSITDRSPLCQLTIVHDRLTAGSRLNDDFDDGWLLVASGLKTLIEAGRIMPLRDDEAAALAAEAAVPEAETAPVGATP